MAKLEVRTELLTSADAALSTIQVSQRAQHRAAQFSRSTVICTRGRLSDRALASRANAVATVPETTGLVIGKMATFNSFAVSVVPAPITQN